MKPYEPARVDSVIELPQSVKQSTAIVNNRAVVVDVGPEAWKGETPRAKPGDKVFITGYAGFLTVGTLDNQLYRIINDNDIFCRIDGESNG